MIYLLLAIVSSSMVSISMRLSEGKINSKIGMLAVNYFICLVANGLFIGSSNLLVSESGMGQTLCLGGFNGFLYVAALVLVQYNIKNNGLILTSMFQKLGLLVPLVLSIVIFGESPTWLQVCGFFLAMTAIVMLNYEKGHGGSFKPALLLVLLADGGAMSMLKVFNEVGNPALDGHFLLFTFTAAFLLCMGIVFYKKEHIGKKELFYGTLLGVPNGLASRFILGALETIPAVIVYPTRGVAVVVLVSLVGIFLFGERLAKKQWLAMVMILAALVMLNV